MQVCNGNEQQKEQTEIMHGQFGEEKAGRSTKFADKIYTERKK